MKLIAHRGLYSGPNRDKENTPDQLLKAIELGYDCEVDVWHTDNRFFLGHDSPTYPTTIEFISNPKFWIHAKNFEALEKLQGSDLNYFWHQEDDHTLTSKGFIWTYPGKEIGINNIIVMPEMVMPIEDIKNIKAFAICSDYVSQL
jgi:glycerophosphoryl diester phosphodiesterase